MLRGGDFGGGGIELIEFWELCLSPWLHAKQSITSTAMSAVDFLIMAKNLEDDYRMQKIFFCIIILMERNREGKQIV
jgi:hypothetical protein